MSITIRTALQAYVNFAAMRRREIGELSAEMDKIDNQARAALETEPPAQISYDAVEAAALAYQRGFEAAKAWDSVPPAAPTSLEDHAIDLFAAAMKKRMAEMKAKGKDGWYDPAQCTIRDLRSLLRAASADQPVDVGNYAMMVYYRTHVG